MTRLSRGEIKCGLNELPRQLAVWISVNWLNVCSISAWGIHYLSFLFSTLTDNDLNSVDGDIVTFAVFLLFQIKYLWIQLKKKAKLTWEKSKLGILFSILCFPFCQKGIINICSTYSIDKSIFCVLIWLQLLDNHADFSAIMSSPHLHTLAISKKHTVNLVSGASHANSDLYSTLLLLLVTQ